MDEIKEKKARAYDAMEQIQIWQQILQKLNNDIAELKARFNGEEKKSIEKDKEEEQIIDAT
jgi:hypothetical protein